MKRLTAFLFMIYQMNACPAIPFKLIFVPQFGQAVDFTEPQYQRDGADSVKFGVLKFYVSGITFYDGGEKIYSEPGSFHLVDASDAASLVITVDAPGYSFDSIGFNLGIDSITNNSGAMGGDLDPTKGMYWTWQSGYINFKLEGISNKSVARSNEFQFHLGGYSYPNNALRNLSFALRKRSSAIIEIDLLNLFRQIDFSRHSHIMSPGVDAMELSTIVQSCFKLADE
jgi:hypothetical protein